MGNLSNDRVRQVYMDHCAKLMSMQKLFRHNPDAREVEKLVLTACFELKKVLEPHMTPEEKKTRGAGINQAKTRIEAALQARRDALAEAELEGY